MNSMFTNRTDFRKNTTEQWYPTDSLSAYNPVQLDGKQNYTKDAFEYKFNSEGFRCDEFTTQSDLPIMFMGCSFTEGIGLPLHHTWPHFLIEIIKQQPGLSKLSIPHHSIALGGTGVDFPAALLPKYAAITTPKFIVGFFSSLYRRDFCANDMHVQQWLHADTPIPYYKKELGKVFSDPAFALHQSYRSLLTIDLVAQLHGAKAYVFIEKHKDDVALPSSLFKSLEIVHLTVGRYVHPPYLEDTPAMARDNMHHGAKWQYTLATHVADKIVPNINPAYTQTKRPPYDPLAIQGVPYLLPGVTPPDPPLSPNPAVRVLKQMPNPSWLT